MMLYNLHNNFFLCSISNLLLCENTAHYIKSYFECVWLHPGVDLTTRELILGHISYNVVPPRWKRPFAASTLFLEMALYEHCRYSVQPCKPITGPKDSLELAGDTIIDPPPCVTVGNCGHLLASSTHKPVQMLEGVWKMTYQTILRFPFGCRFWVRL